MWNSQYDIVIFLDTLHRILKGESIGIIYCKLETRLFSNLLHTLSAQYATDYVVWAFQAIHKWVFVLKICGTTLATILL